MPYKIVQTREKGQTKLAIIPTSWEKNGKLWWPPKKLEYRLTKDEQSKPDKKEWTLMDCILKRNNIQTYEHANAELLTMEENSDTDFNDTYMVAPHTTENQNREASFEVMANKLVSFFFIFFLLE